MKFKGNVPSLTPVATAVVATAGISEVGSLVAPGINNSPYIGGRGAFRAFPVSDPCKAF